MHIINSSRSDLGLILYLGNAGYGQPCRLPEGCEIRDLKGPRKLILTFGESSHHRVEGVVEFVEDPSPLEGVYVAPPERTLNPVKLNEIWTLYVWRFSPGFRPTLPR
jgi:hypothetical protein